MKISIGDLSAILVLITWAAWPMSEARAEAAAELIEQARQYDYGYTSGPDASQKRALEVYQQALNATPDPQQRRHILFRMAQLHSTACRRDQGEKPDYPQALRLYQQVAASGSPEEPLVLQATTGVADCLVTLGRFDEAMRWSRQVLRANTRTLEEQIKALEESLGEPEHTHVGGGEPPADPETLRHQLRQMQQTQCAAVDQIAYAALQVNPLWARIQLRTLEEQYAGTCIARRARRLLEHHPDRIPEAFTWSEPLPPVTDSSILSNTGPPSSLLPHGGQAGLPAATPAAPSADTAATPGPGREEKPLAERVPARWPRGPPWTRTQRVLTAVAGLALIVLATRRFLRGSL